MKSRIGPGGKGREGGKTVENLVGKEKGVSWGKWAGTLEGREQRTLECTMKRAEYEK